VCEKKLFTLNYCEPSLGFVKAAEQTGGQGVVGSNPAAPTIHSPRNFPTAFNAANGSITPAPISRPSGR
jgi:hypothetical protein